MPDPLPILGNGPIALICLFLISAILSSIFVAATRRLALRSKFIDHPNSNTGNAGGAALGGGIAIVAAIFLMSLLTLGLDGAVGRIAVLAVSACLLGLLDDVFKLQPATKVIGQAACAILYAALTGVEFYEFVFIVLFLILTSNAWNVVDVMDSLLASIATVCLIGVSAVLAIHGIESRGLSAMALISAGSTAGFLLWNWPPAKILMGDAGSISLGMLYGALVTEAHSNAPGLAAALILPGLIPYLEVIFLIIQRSMKRIPFYETTPDHFALRLLHNGHTVGEVIAPVTWAGIGLSVLACLVAFTAFDFVVLAAVIVALSAAVWWAYRYFGRLPVRGPLP